MRPKPTLPSCICTTRYNTAYARNLAPGASIVVIRLYGRDQGFIVQAGNPKRLTSWGALLRGGVRLVNREKGSGSRILLDEKLQAMDARGEVIEGYTTQVAGAQAAVGRIASGVADVTIGTAREAAQSSDVDFVPLQTEWIDVVIAKNDSTRPLVRQLKSIAASDDLRRNLQALGPCDISKLGSITFEA